MSRVAVVVPLKSFAVGKGRLRGIESLNVEELSRQLAAAVIAAAAPRDVYVVGESDDVANFAGALGAQVLRHDHTGLNNAVQFAFGALRSSYEVVVIVHGDLRNPTGLGAFTPGPGVTIVQDHHQRGTTVLAVPTSSDFTFHYGENSCHLHAQEARARSLDCHIVTDSPWQFDIDEPEDLQ